MKIITVSREFGSGGRELGKRLADYLKFDYYDSEILTAVAQNSGLDQHYVEDQLSDHGWQAFPLTFHGTIGSTGYLQSSRVELLLKQKEAIEKIAAMGKDCVIVGRNADVILQQEHPFNLFVCAEPEAKIKRCLERASAEEKLTERELIHKMRQIDKMRAQTRAILSGSPWGQRDAYHITINTSNWNIKDIIPAVAQFANCWFGRTVCAFNSPITSATEN